jgi:hypothetical protein
LFLKNLKEMLDFLAEQKKAFVRWGLATLMTATPQTYPQFLGISWMAGATVCCIPD